MIHCFVALLYPPMKVNETDETRPGHNPKPPRRLADRLATFPRSTDETEQIDEDLNELAQRKGHVPFAQKPSRTALAFAIARLSAAERIRR
jgi:hypothetical protein